VSEAGASAGESTVYWTAGSRDGSYVARSCVVPPILTAGGTPRNTCMLSKQFCVADKFTYPGKAKNSMETLSRAGSTVTAPSGMLGGTVNEVVVLPSETFEESVLLLFPSGCC